MIKKKTDAISEQRGTFKVQEEVKSGTVGCQRSSEIYGWRVWRPHRPLRSEMGRRCTREKFLQGSGSCPPQIKLLLARLSSMNLTLSQSL